MTTLQSPVTETHPFDVSVIRADFPILERTVRDGKFLVYLDSGATSQRPITVIDAEQESNVTGHHSSCTSWGARVGRRGDRLLRRRARARRLVHRGEPRSDELIFTKNATESLNLVAYSLGNASIGATGPGGGGGLDGPFGRFVIGPGDEILVTEMEHHANLIPWQELCRPHRRHPALVLSLTDRLPARSVEHRPN